MSIRGFILFFLPFCFACNASMNEAATNFPPFTYPADSPEIQYIGRTTQERRGVRFAWTGTEIRLRFEGPSIRLQLLSLPGSPEAVAEGYQDHYDVWIDDTVYTRLITDYNRSAYDVATHLRDTTHTIKIFKRTEAMVGIGILQAVTLAEGKKLLPPLPLSDLQIEFIGNSITAGFGNLGDSAACVYSPDTQDGGQTFASLTAKALSADFQAICYSGRGIWRNYSGETSGNLLDLYPLVNPQNREVWKVTNWNPAFVVINAGTNDFANPEPDQQAFVKNYQQLLRIIRQRYPQTQIICLSGPLLYGQKLRKHKKWIKESIKLRKQKGDTRIYRLDLSPQGKLGFGCASHPNLAQHRLNAEELTQLIQSLL
ncbi:MAG: SGNH/GDSL hydrolase family protein [Bacteroidota bacterium]